MPAMDREELGNVMGEMRQRDYAAMYNLRLEKTIQKSVLHLEMIFQLFTCL